MIWKFSECPELIIENGKIKYEPELNQNIVSCDKTYRFYGYLFIDYVSFKFFGI